VAQDLGDEQGIPSRLAACVAGQREPDAADRPAGPAADQIDDLGRIEPGQGESGHTGHAVEVG